MNTLTELHAALSTLRTEIAIALPWDTLHRWFGAAPLAPPHYRDQPALGADATNSENRPVPTVYLYHGANKLTLVRNHSGRCASNYFCDLAQFSSPVND